MPPVNYWQGRKVELAQIQEWLSEPSTVLVGITGLGGFGKSTLAAKLLDESAASRKFWADVRTGTDFSSLARRVLAAWGMAAEQVQSIPELNLSDALVRQLQEQSGLLVIDNLETLLNEAGEWQNPVYQQFLQQWIEVGAQSKLLLTSRERPVLEARRTRWYALVKGLSAAEGAALLRDLGIRGEAAELEALVAQVGGYPLSLMLVAGLLLAEEELDPQVRYLSHYGNLFQIRGLHRGENQASIEQVFSWSFDRLSPKLQHLLTQISVFRRAFNVKAADTLVPDHKITEADLRQLVRRSLLQELPRDKTNQRQFQLQPQVRELVQQRAGNLRVAHQRAIMHFLFTAQRSDSWKVLEDVSEYLEIFHHWCELQQYAAAFNALWCSKCDVFLELWGYNLERTQLYQPLITKWQPNDAELEGFGEMLNRLGNAYFSIGQYQQAIEFHNQHLNIARQIGDRQGEATSLVGLGNVYNALDEYQQAIEFYQQSLNIERQIGHRYGEAIVFDNLGNAYYSLGQYPQAIKFHQQSLEIAQQIGDRQGEAASLGNLGNAYRSIGQYQQAIEFHNQHLNIARQIGDRQGEAASFGGLGNVYDALGEYQQAIEFHDQHLNIARQIRDRRGEATALGNLGNAYYSLGQYPQAIKFHQQSLEIAQQIGDRQREAASLGNLGNAYRSIGQYQQAIEFYQQSLNIERQIGHRYGEAKALSNLGLAYDSIGEYQQAIEFYQQSLEIAQQINDIQQEAGILGNLGAVLEDLGQTAAAKANYQKARDLYAAMGVEQWRQWCEDRLQQLETGSA